MSKIDFLRNHQECYGKDFCNLEELKELVGKKAKAVDSSQRANHKLRNARMKRGKLYTIVKHYTIAKNVPQGPTVTVKPTAYLLSLPPGAAIAEVTSYVESLEDDPRQYSASSTSEHREKVSTAQFELEVAQQFLADLKQRYENGH